MTATSRSYSWFRLDLAVGHVDARACGVRRRCRNIEKLSGSAVITPVLTLIARTLPLPKSAMNTLDPTTTMPPNAPVVWASGASRVLVVASITADRSVRVGDVDPRAGRIDRDASGACSPTTAQTVMGEPETCWFVAVSMIETDPPRNLRLCTDARAGRVDGDAVRHRAARERDRRRDTPVRAVHDRHPVLAEAFDTYANGAAIARDARSGGTAIRTDKDSGNTYCSGKSLGERAFSLHAPRIVQRQCQERIDVGSTN